MNIDTINRASQLVDTEIFACLTSHIQALIEAQYLNMDDHSGVFVAHDWDDIVMNFSDYNDGYKIIDHNDGHYSIQDEDGDYVYQWYTDTVEMVQAFYNDGNGDISDAETEIYEYWLVSSWLHGKLEDVGEAVEIINGMHIWSRTSTNTAIKMDWCMNAIAQEMLDKYPTAS